MKIFSRMFQFKIYRSIILSYGLMFTITVSILSCILFYLFANSAAREINNYSKIMLSQTSYASEVIYNQVTNISSQLLNDTDIISFLYSSETSKVNAYNISLKLSRIQNVYPFIRSIGVYNIGSNMNIDTVGIAIESEFIKANGKKYIKFFPRRVKIEGFNNNMPYELITFILFPDFSLRKTSNSAIVINIDEKYILNTINSISNLSPESSTFVIDSNGQVLSHIDPGFFMKDISRDEHIARILSENKNQGSFLHKINQKSHLVTYVKSSKMSWFFVNVKTYDQLITNINDLRNTILLIAIFLILAGIMVSTSLAGAIYNPIKSLLEKVSLIKMDKDTILHKVDEYKLLSEAFSKSEEASASMRSSIYRSSILVKESYIMGLLKGNFSAVEVTPEVYESIISKFSGPYYCLILFKIDNPENFRKLASARDQQLLRFIVCNISQEQLSGHFRCEHATPEEDEVVVLAQFDKEHVSDDLYLTLTEIQDAISNYFKITVSIAIGGVIDALEGISISYKQLQEIIKYRLFYGYECILTQEKIRNQAANSILYQYGIEKRLIDAVQQNSSKLVQAHINELMSILSAANYFDAINNSCQVVLSIFKHFDSVSNAPESILKDQYDTISKIRQARVIDEIANAIGEFCVHICRVIEEENSNANLLKHKKIIDDIKLHIKENYYNPNLSIEMAADVAELSPGYLGKLFKSIAAVSFNDYVNNVRLEMAKELLLSTNEPASRICEKVGIYNITYFSTLFKKIYGMTPSQFRSRAASGSSRS